MDIKSEGERERMRNKGIMYVNKKEIISFDFFLKIYKVICKRLKEMNERK